MASDNFNRANETPLASPWTKSADAGLAGGQLNLSSNAVVSNGNDSAYYYSGAAATEGQYAQIATASGSVTSTQAGGPAVRMATGSSIDAYVFDNFLNTSNGTLTKWVNGSSSSLGAGAIARALPLRIEANGSTIRILANGVESLSVTDTSVDSGGQPGMFWYHTSSFDDWDGGDLSVVVAPNPEMVPLAARISYVG